MPALVIGALRVDLGLETSAFQKGAGAAQKHAQALGARMQAIGGRMQAIGGVMTAVSGSVIFALTAMTKKGLDYASSLGETAQQLGVTTDELQKFRYAASQVGIENEAMDKSLAKLTVNIGKAANGNGAAQKAFAGLGISVRDAEGNVKSAGKIMPEIADAIAKIPDPARRAAAEVALFGKSGQQLDTLLAGGAAKMNELTSAAEKLGIVLSPEQIAKADAAADKFSALQQVMSAKIAGVVADNSDAILGFVEGISNALVGVMDFFAQMGPGFSSFAIGVAAVGAAAGPVLMVLGSLVSMAGTIAPLFASGGVLAGAFAGFSAAILPVTAAVAAMVGGWLLIRSKVQPVLDELWAKVQDVLGGKLGTLIASASKLLSELWAGPLGSFIRGVIDILGELAAVVVKVLGETLIRVVSAAVDIVGGAFGIIGNAIKLVGALLTGDWAGAWEAAKNIVSTAIRTVLNVIESLVPGATAAVRNLYLGVKEWLQDKLGGVVKWLADKLGYVGDLFFQLYDRVVGHSYIPDLVEGVGMWMAKLQQNMVDVAVDANDKVGQAFRGLEETVAPILGRLFPQQARLLSYENDKNAIVKWAEKAGVAGEELQKILDALHAELLKDLAPEGWNPFSGADGTEMPTDGIKKANKEIAESAEKDMAKPVKKTLGELVTAYADMAKGVIGSVRDIVSNFKSGNTIDAIVGIIDMVGNVISMLQQIGAISAPSAPQSTSYGGARALGGAVVPGKTYRVGERGPEYFTPGARGMISPAGTGPGGGNTYVFKGNLLTEEWWGQIDHKVNQGSAKAAMQGSNMALETINKRSRSRLRRG